MALKDIKTKIGATNRMHTVTRAMEAVSAVKMRKTQDAAFLGRPYARAALSILTRLSGSDDVNRHVLATARPVKRIALVVITSDKGLAGALNSAVLKAANNVAKAFAPQEVDVFAYGKKGEEFFGRRNYNIVRAYENKSDDVSIESMETLSAELADGFVRGKFDEVHAVYSNFKSTFEQLPTARILLPLSPTALAQLVDDIRPVKGKWSHDTVLTSPASYAMEQEAEEIVSILIPRLVSVSLYHMLLEAKASEHSARMIAMKNASDKSKEVVRALTRTYNRVRQAAITREVSEIVSGREALAH